MILGIFLINDMQTLPPPPPILKNNRFFCSKTLRNVLKRMKNKFSDFRFLSYDRFSLQFPSDLPAKNGKKKLSKDAQCSETDF